MTRRTVILTILDGWGVGAKDNSNPIHAVNPPTIKFIKGHYPAGTLQASGISVGLPWGEEGNSEVGHLTMGAGKIVYQYFPKISIAARNGSFFQNSVIKNAFAHAKNNNSVVHLAGLLASGNVHASFEHLKALLEFARREGITNLQLHLFTDGMDSPPQSFLSLLQELEKELQKHGRGKISSLGGRAFAMDRDSNWSMTQQAYQAMAGEKEEETDNLEKYVQENYKNGTNDEFLKPIRMKGGRTVQDNDSLFFFNFREERMKQIFDAFADPRFKEFETKKFKNLHLASMTRYDKEIDAPAAFEADTINSPLGKILADQKKTQLRIAETEKYAHVTYFFDGLKNVKFEGEEQTFIPSNRDASPAERPEMKAEEITEAVLRALFEEKFDFILMNYANPDMVGHTGNFEAAKKTVRIIDLQLNKILQAVLARNAVWIITSDHGNIERMLNPVTGEPETKHDSNPVPVYVAAKELRRVKTEAEMEESEKIPIGILADLAPTILSLLGISKPPEMSGSNLLISLK